MAPLPDSPPPDSPAEAGAPAKPVQLIKQQTMGGTEVIHEAYADQFQDAKYEGNFVFLPRGGILVRTNGQEGIEIQFGMPPETIKVRPLRKINSPAPAA
jgi:hypothetical protein